MRGETLSYLRTPRDPTTTTTGGMSPATGPTTPSGSERAQQKAAAEKAAKEQAKTTSPENRAQQKSRLKAIGNFLNALLPSTSHNSSTTKQESALKRFFKKSREEPKKPAPVPTRADKGHVSPPTLAVNSGVTDHMKSAFLEYVAVVRATKEVHLMTCRKIMLTFQRGTEGLLGVLLKEAGAAVYDNATSQVIAGEMTGSVQRDERLRGPGSGRVGTHRTARFETPKGDSIVVTAKCTRIMLEDRILEMAQAISGTAEPPALQGGWAVPKIQWVNGVPGCGKTTWVVSHFNEEEDVVATTTTEAAKDLREKLAHRLGQRTRTRVRTMASILSNGFRAHDKCHRIIVDEALMNHFGAIVMAARLSGASEVVLVGDVNQLPFLDRENLFQLNYTRPNVVAAITHELSCTHRNPMDVAYTLGRYTLSRVHSLRVERYTGAKIPRLAQNTLFLVHTQEEKADLASQGYGSGEGSRLLTIHEAQGLTSDYVLVINTKTRRLQIHESVSHAVVAVSRHRVSCVYYTDDADDAAGRLIKKAMEANTKMVWKVDDSVTSSDHRAIRVVLGLRVPPRGGTRWTTRRFNTRKAEWGRFTEEMRSRMTTRGLNLERINNTNNKIELEGVAPHPASEPDVDYRCLEDISKSVDGVGAAYSYWRDGTEIRTKRMRLESMCTVFQAELLAIARATDLVVRGGFGEGAVHRWNERYTGGATAEVTRMFFPGVSRAYRVLGYLDRTSIWAQVLTGHGGFAAYLHKFKLKDSAACVCDPEVPETIQHLLLECPRHDRDRYDLEVSTGIKLNEITVAELMANKGSRPYLKRNCLKIAKIAIDRNRTR
ncbi:hypothetical protein HW555_006146 [Spodoptera exigua]|uniref:(+)RNA virus helicase C-terminal domain-containing protein n=1 Tax=Spodoptera exigua TaxID=7107 RepID=A0A835L5N7_SPOEX|nr:hypothetical protein HW555_006146 [Spodoptera exigua]